MATLTLHNGDCLEIMKEISDKSVDLIICDLPYGCLTPCGAGVKNPDKYPPGTKTGGCAWDIKIDLDAFWKQVRRIRKSDNSPTIHFCTTKFGYDLIKSNPDEFRYDLVWDKQRGVSFLSANKMPMRSHEMIYIFSKAGAFYERKDFTGDFKKWNVNIDRKINPQTYHGGVSFAPTNKEGGDGTRCVLSVVKPPQYMNFKQSGPRTRKEDTSTQYGTKRTKEVKDNTGKRCVLSVVEHSGSVKKGNHPTEKPEALYRFLIERYCPANGVVFDPTFGSGNSVFTAFAMGRSAIGIEKDDTFFKKAEERLNALP